MSVLKRLGGVFAVAGLAAMMPHDANAWWSGGVGVGFGFHPWS